MSLCIALLAGGAVGGGTDGPAALNDRALALLADGDADGAVKLLEEATRLDDDRTLVRNLAVALNNRGLKRLEAHRTFAAIADFERAVELDGDEPLFRIHLGYAWLRARDLGRAELQLRAAAQRWPDEPKVWDFLGFLHYMQDDLDKAVAAYERRLELADDPWAREQLERARRELAVTADFVDRSASDFTLKFLGDPAQRAIADQVLAWLEEARARVGSDLDFFPQQRTTVLLYSDRDFRRATGAHAWIGGLYDGKIRLPIRDFPRRRDAIRRTILHEYTHRVLSEMAPALPVWLNEGTAEWFENEGRGAHDEARRRAAEGRPLPRIIAMPESFVEESDAEVVRDGYAVARSFTAFLRDRWGPGAFRAFLLEVGRGGSLDLAARRQFGLDLSGLEMLWRREALGER